MTKLVSILVAALVACAIGAALAAKSVARRPGAIVAGHIAYIGGDGNVYVCDGACNHPDCITCPSKAEQALAKGPMPALLADHPGQQPVLYDWPTYSPDARAIAYSSARRGADSTNYAVHSYDLARRTAVTIFQSPGDRPIYLFWLPDSRHLFLLVSDGESLKLMLAQAAEAKPVRIILTGQPLFFDWNQKLNELAFHYVPAGGSGAERAGLMSITDRDQRVVKVLSQGTTPFRNPAWSPDGSHLAYVVDNKNGQAALVIANSDGSSPVQMVGLPPDRSSFIWAQDSRRIAFSTVKRGEATLFDGINLLDTADGKITSLVSDPVVAYYFSPDMRHLAYIGVTPGSNTWNLLDLPSGKARKIADFITTDTATIAFRLFDQFVLSHRIWSPDSKAIAFAGVMVKGGNEPPPPSTVMPPASVWLLPIGKQPAQALAQGRIAFWSPVP